MKLSSIAESQENGVFKDAEGGIPQGKVDIRLFESFE
jgi:hypothetical protein